jgi:hypothetical protein
MPYLQGKCSYQHAEYTAEEEGIQHRPRACTQWPPAHADARRVRMSVNISRVLVLNNPRIVDEWKPLPRSNRGAS